MRIYAFVYAWYWKRVLLGYCVKFSIVIAKLEISMLFWTE